MTEKDDRIFECPNCYYRITEAAIAAASEDYDCPGCGTETINYFTPVEEEQEDGE